jgi:hypothetical protein
MVCPQTAVVAISQAVSIVQWPHISSPKSIRLFVSVSISWREVKFRGHFESKCLLSHSSHSRRCALAESVSPENAAYRIRPVGTLSPHFLHNSLFAGQSAFWHVVCIIASLETKAVSNAVTVVPSIPCTAAMSCLPV